MLLTPLPPLSPRPAPPCRRSRYRRRWPGGAAVLHCGAAPRPRPPPPGPGGERGYRGGQRRAPGRNVPARSDNGIYSAAPGGSAPPAPLRARTRRPSPSRNRRRPAQVSAAPGGGGTTEGAVGMDVPERPGDTQRGVGFRSVSLGEDAAMGCPDVGRPDAGCPNVGCSSVGCCHLRCPDRGVPILWVRFRPEWGVFLHARRCYAGFSATVNSPTVGCCCGVLGSHMGLLGCGCPPL